MEQTNTSEPPQPCGALLRSPGRSHFLVDKDSGGNWVARNEAGSCGGLFVSRSEAVRFAIRESDSRPLAVIMAPGILELTAGSLSDEWSRDRPDLERQTMRISSTASIEGRRILYTIGTIQAASAWHAANDSPRQDHWREHVLDELIQKAEDAGADAIIDFGYENSRPIGDSETGVPLKCILATGIAVKLSCAA